MMKYHIYILIMTVLGSLAALFLKQASGSRNIKSLIMNVKLYIGAGLYFISALINIYVLKFLPYSVVLPMTSITYIWTMVVAHFILRERITTKKIIGTTFIIVGALVLALPS